MVAVVASIAVDMFLYLFFKKKFFCIPDTLDESVCTYDTFYMFLMWGTFAIFLPVWYFFIKKMRPFCLKEAAEKAADGYTKA